MSVVGAEGLRSAAGEAIDEPPMHGSKQHEGEARYSSLVLLTVAPTSQQLQMRNNSSYEDALGLRGRTSAKLAWQLRVRECGVCKRSWCLCQIIFSV